MSLVFVAKIKNDFQLFFVVIVVPLCSVMPIVTGKVYLQRKGGMDTLSVAGVPLLLGCVCSSLN